LKCENNQLTTLYVSSNNVLENLDCHSNQISNLNFINPISLISFDCADNQIASLNLSGASALNYLNCSDNQLNFLNLSNLNITTLYFLNCSNNPNLLCIDVDNPSIANSIALSSGFWIYSSPLQFSLDCNLALGCTNPAAINYNSISSIDNGTCYFGKTYVPDDNFESFLEANGMGDSIMNNDSVSTELVSSIFHLDVHNQNIFSLIGIEDFISLKSLDCWDNQLSSLNLSSNSDLEIISCWDNQLTNLDVSQNTALTELYCLNNQLTSLDIRNGNNNSLEFINSSNNLDLFCINVDNVFYSSSNWNNSSLYHFDSWVSFDTNCIAALGCTDSIACNFNSLATINDSSCNYLPLSINNVQVTCSNDSNATLMVIYNSGFYNFDWSNGESTQMIDSLPIGSYSVIVSDTTGCSTTLSADVTLSPAPALNMFPEICYVTIDSISGSNKIIIKQMGDTLTSKFIIHKESSANVYNPIDTISNNILEYLDVSSNPMIQSYRYKVSVLDTCGNESVKSYFHKTIHLTMSLGVNDEINLLWNTYEGFQPSDYLIFRSINNGTMNQIGILPGTNLTYTDLSPPSGTLNYQIRAIVPNCNIIPFAKNATNMLTSNLINHSTTVVNELVNSKKVIKVTDLLGREAKGSKNEPLLYLYDDGTVEKRIVIE
jgi:hypothetical protein